MTSLAALVLPPSFKEGNNYEAYKKEIEIWQLMKPCSAEEQGPLLFRTLTGRAKVAALELSVKEVGSAKGLELILKKLDKLYLADKNKRICSVLEQFESFRRSPNMTMAMFVLDFERLHNELEKFQIVYPDGVLAYRIMKAANMSRGHEELLRATVATGEWSYDAVKEQLSKIFNDVVAIKPLTEASNSAPEMPIKIEETFFSDSNFEESQSVNANYDEDVIQYENFTNADSENEYNYPKYDTSSETHDIYYGPSKGNTPWKWNTQNYRRSNQGIWRPRSYQSPPNQRTYQRVQDNGNYQKFSQKPNPFTQNPKDYRGFPTVCRKCRSIYHYWENCPHVSPQERMNATPKKVMFNQNNTQEDLYIALFQKSSPTTCDEVICLMSETLDKAVLDSGCTKSCAGKRWFTSYCESLSDDELNQIQTQETQSVFRFGDSPPVVASEKVLLPIKLGNKDILLETEIVPSDIPLLLSKETMKRAKAKMCYEKDKIELFGEEQDMLCTTSGHYAVPIGKSSIKVPSEEMKSTIVLFSQKDNDKKAIAKKLHTQFCHPSATKLIQTIENSGNNDLDLKKAIEEVTLNCDICKRYKKSRPKPVVSFPMASEFNETIAMDLKIYQNNSIYILHIVDHVTRFSAGAIIRSKKAEVIIHSFLKIWVSIFGTPKKVLSDNGGEFANAHFIDMCQNFNINFLTTSAESPWSNGLVEKHNHIIGEAIAKIQEDVNCSVEIALCWALNAKNSLQNIYGFSPHQLVFGKNPNIPTVMNSHLPALEGISGSRLIADHLNAQHAARQQMIKMESSEKLRRALRAQTRTHSNVTYINGDNVFYKREGESRWRGPGRVIGQDGSKILIKIPTGLVSVHSSCVNLTSDNSGMIGDDDNLSEEKANNSAEEINSEIINQNTSIPTEFDQNASSEFLIPRDKGNNVIVVPRDKDNDAPVNDGKENTDNENNYNEINGQNPEELINPLETDNIPDLIDPPETNCDENKENEITMNVNQDLDLPFSKQIVRYKLKDSNEWSKCVILSRWGNLPSRRKCKHVLKIRDLDDNTEKCIDWIDSVDEWEPLQENIFVASCLNSEISKDEFIEEKLFLVSDKAFDEAKATELKNWINMQVYDEVNDNGQEYITVKWVFSEKKSDEKVIKKARLVARGYEELTETQTDSPTADKMSSRIALSIIASKGWKINVLDIKAAFLQGQNLDREIYLKPPKEAQCSGKLWRLKRCVYGLNDASRFWYLRVKEELTRLECQKSKYDSALFMHRTNELEGILVAHVDDFLWAGTNHFYTKVVLKLKETFKISKEESSEFKYLGVNLKQTREGIYGHLNNYSQSLVEIEIESCRLKEKESPLNREETDLLRSVIGKLNWLATQTRPDLSFDVCELSTRLKSGTVKLLEKANDVIKKAKYNSIFLHFPVLNLNDIAVRCYADASFANLPDGGSQGGLYVEVVSKNKSSPLFWQSKRLSRTPRSTLSAETISMVDGMETALLAGKLISEILCDSKIPIPVEGVTDNYSLFEVAHTTTAPTEKRMRIELTILRETINQNEFVLKWIDSPNQLADSLTKKGSDPRNLLRRITGKNVI